jgi:hypothetical protein
LIAVIANDDRHGKLLLICARTCRSPDGACDWKRLVSLRSFSGLFTPHSLSFESKMMPRMSDPSRIMALTPELVALCRRAVPESDPEPEHECFENGDYDRAVGMLLAQRPKGSFWLFAYGSLIWKPEFPIETTLRGVADGWRRSFCLRITRYRGTPKRQLHDVS